jgi:hypothetical protein
MVELAMTTSVSNTRLAWQNRWSQPGLETLLNALKPHHRRAFNHLMQGIDVIEGVSKSLIWYGPGWKWTLQYVQAPGPKAGNRKGGTGNGQGPAPAELSQALCYLVPDSQMPLVCVPLSAGVIEQLPLKRLSKYIRDGIAVAKCAVAIRWAVWSPISDSEAGLLMDLIKRKCTITSGGGTARGGSAGAAVAGSAGSGSGSPSPVSGSGRGSASHAAKVRSNGSTSGNGQSSAKPVAQVRPTKKSA